MTGREHHLKIFVWMMVGLIEKREVALPVWVSDVRSRATQSASTVRPFSRWLRNSRIKPMAIWKVYVRAIWAHVGEGRLYVALDTTSLVERVLLGGSRCKFHVSQLRYRILGSGYDVVLTNDGHDVKNGTQPSVLVTQYMNASFYIEHMSVVSGSYKGLSFRGAIHNGTALSVEYEDDSKVFTESSLVSFKPCARLSHTHYGSGGNTRIRWLSASAT